MIETAETYARRFPGRFEVPPAAEGTPVGAVEVYVNHGRWVWDCPAPRCTAAQFARDDGGLAACLTCGHGPLKVVWPAERPDIERLLDLREEKHRNWQVGESLATLREENIAHGVGV